MSVLPRRIELASVIADALPRDRARKHRVQLIAKRALDIVASSILLFVLAVPMLAIAIAIRLESRGGVIIRQLRVGRAGASFTMFKFRTMRNGAERMQEELAPQNEHDGPIFKMRHDPRRTRVGAFLRRTSLDELPNLINVLLGQMTLVGPRPPLDYEVLGYSARELSRLAVKPGMTGLWQVSGRSLLSWDEMVSLDLEYIRRWSFALDVLILLRTIPAVVTGRGAY